jgi:hypothetical protein
MRLRYALILLTAGLGACDDETTNVVTDMSVAGDLSTAGDLARAGGDGGVTAGTTVNGAIGGSAFVAGDAINVEANASGLDFNGKSTDVLITSFSGACAKQAANAGVANGRLLFFGLAVTDSAGNASPVTATGDYTIAKAPLPNNAKVAQAFYEKDGADCLKATNLDAASGKITVTNPGAGGGTLEGTFDLTFGSEHITGSFSAPRCASFNPNRTPLDTCM